MGAFHSTKNTEISGPKLNGTVKIPGKVFENLGIRFGRFPFDQIFRFEIPGIPCDEWNSIFRFQVWRENGIQHGLCSSSEHNISALPDKRLKYLSWTSLQWICLNKL